MSGKIIPLSDEHTRHIRRWNAGYHDGYNGNNPQDIAEPYQTAFATGIADRIEDEQALASGQLDHLDESEREFLYGDEERFRDYTPTDG